MATATKEDILLRETINAPLTTTGVEFTYANLDDNFITLYNQLLALSQSSNIAAFDAAKTYIGGSGEAVMYSNQLYKLISLVDSLNETPSSYPLVWEKIYATDLVGQVNGIKTFEKTFTTAEVLASGITGGVALDLIPALGANQVPIIQSGSVTTLFNTGSPAGTPYATNTGLMIGSSSLDFASAVYQWKVNNILAAECKQTLPFQIGVDDAGVYDESIEYFNANEAVVAYTAGTGPTAGDSDITIRGEYIVIDNS